MVTFEPNTACHLLICLSLSPGLLPLFTIAAGTAHLACCPFNLPRTLYSWSLGPCHDQQI